MNLLSAQLVRFPVYDENTKAQKANKKYQRIPFLCIHLKFLQPSVAVNITEGSTFTSEYNQKYIQLYTNYHKTTTQYGASESKNYKP